MRKNKGSLIALQLPGDEEERLVDSSIFGKTPLEHFKGDDTYEVVEQRLAKRFILLRLVRTSLHSSKVRELLAERAICEATIEWVIAELTAAGYLNDQSWVDAYVGQQQRRGQGPRAIGQKLRSKGVDRKVAADAAALLQAPEKQMQGIAALLEGRYRNCDLSDTKVRQKLIAALLRRGFDYSAISDVLRRHLIN